MTQFGVLYDVQWWLTHLGFSAADYDVKEFGGQSEYLKVTLKEYLKCLKVIV